MKNSNLGGKKIYRKSLAAFPLLIISGSFLAFSSAHAGTCPFQVIPWNSYKAALSLTYDDGDPIHLDVAIPEMNKRKLRGTFFLISGPLTRAEEWKKAVAAGQEIGNHTVHHKHFEDFKEGEAQSEVELAKTSLQNLFGISIVTFGYPFVVWPPQLRKAVEANNFIARGGGGPDCYLTPDMNPDWYNLSCQGTMTPYAFETYKNWVNQDLAAEAWTILAIHAIEGSNWYQPIPKKTYIELLDYLVQNKKDIWVAPFGEIGAYWRAQKVLEGAKPQKEGSTTTIKWEKPANFPAEVKVKLAIEGDSLKVSQAGKPVKPLSPGVYAVSFDAGELTLANALWKPQTVPTHKTPVAAKAAVIDAGSITAAPDRAVLKVDDFESSSPAYGAAWWEGCDTNGVTKLSPVPFATLAGGSPKSPGHCAGLKGRMAPLQAPWPWAALSLGLDANSKPVDLSAYKAIRFYTQGDGKNHAVALNKASVADYCDFTAAFVSPKVWTQVTIPLTDFAQANWGKPLEKKFNDVLKLTFSPGAADPDFDFKIDDVEFIK